MKVSITLLLILLFAAGCRQIPSDRFLYREACKALENTPGFPEGLVPAPIEQARVSVGKSGGWVEISWRAQGKDGNSEAGTHIVWFKRVARTWTVERITPRSEFAPSE